MNKTLIILVSNYPFAYGEHYLENELFILAQQYDKIYIIITDQKYIGATVKVCKIPDNVEIIEYIETISKKDKLFGIANLFKFKFIEDALLFKKISIQFAKIFLMECIKAKKLSNFILHIISAKKVDTTSCTLYSYWNDYMSVSIANIRKKNPEIKGFARAHGWDVYCERHPLNYLPLRTYIVKNLNSIFFISENGKSYYEKLIPKYSHKYKYSALGTLNSSEIKPYKKEDKIVMMSCSSIIPLKNLWIMIDALSIISEYTIHWVHFGHGYEEDAIKKYAHEKLESKSNIIYDFKGFVLNDQIQEYYNSNQIDFLINCSTTEGVPVSMMEAMSFGVPVIGTDVGGVSEIVIDSENGFLLPSIPTKEDVASNIKKYCSLSEQSIVILRKNAYLTWFQRFNATNNYTSFSNQFSKKISAQNNTLIIFVTNYPYGDGEVFLENELELLSKEFEHIYIITTDQRILKDWIHIAKIQHNVESIKYIEKITLLDKILSLRFLCSKQFVQDLVTFKQISPIFIKIFLLDILKTNKLAAYTNQLIKEKSIPTQHLTIYSYWNDYMSASIACLKQKYPEIKGYTRSHRWDLYCEENPLQYLPLRSYIYKHLDKIFVISNHGKKYLTNLFPEYKSKYVYSPLGTKNNNTLQAYKKSKTIVILSISLIKPVKNISVIIDALSVISDISIQWIHFGVGPDESLIKDYAYKMLRSRSNITYDFKGFITNDKILEFYANNHVDFLINTSFNEGVPVSMMEAMSYGVPVIGTNVGGVNEIIEDSYNGYLLNEIATKKEVAETISKFNSLKEESIIEMRKNAFQTWHSKYNAERNYKDFITLL